MTTKTTIADQRGEYVAGLRMLADLLEQHPELMKPHGAIQVIPLGERQCREQLAAWARALPGRKDKEITDQFANLVGSLRGLKVKVVAYRDEVCERITTGVEIVTKTVKDPQALAAVPEIEVTEEVEQYEWVCRPMLVDELEPVGVS